MTKKKYDFEIPDEPEREAEAVELVVEVHETPPALFEKVSWKNVKEVYKCAACDSFRNMDEKDEFIMHILTHYSNDEEKEAILDRLLKEL